MNLSFKSIKAHLVKRFAGKLSKKQVEDAFEIGHKNLLRALEEKEVEEEKKLKQYTLSDDFNKMKNLSYWIFNNYGIPDDGKSGFHFNLGGGFVISDLNKNEIKAKDIKNGIRSEAYKKIVEEYINEYTDGRLTKTSLGINSVFTKTEKECYPNYKYTSDYWESQYSDTQSTFIHFKSPEAMPENSTEASIIQFAEEKIKVYQDTYADEHKPKLLLPISGLFFDSIDKQKITEDADSWDLSKEELLSNVEQCVDILNSNDFISVTAVYQSQYLMSFVLFRIVWYILSPDNEIIIIDMLNRSLNNLPSYYGNGAQEILKKAQENRSSS